MEPSEASKWLNVVMMLVPDELPEIYERDIGRRAQGRELLLRRARLRDSTSRDRAPKTWVCS